MATRRFWEQRFSWIAKPYIVIGVMPRNFEFPLVPGQLNRVGVVGTAEFHSGELDARRGCELELPHGGAAEARLIRATGGERCGDGGAADHAPAFRR